MSESKTFPAKLKDALFEASEAARAKLLKEYPDIKNRIDIPPTAYYFDLDDCLGEELNSSIIQENQDRLKQIYKTLIRPRNLQFQDDEIPEITFDHVVDDIFNFLIWGSFDEEDYSSFFELAYERFEKDFFSDEINLKLMAHVKNLWAHGGLGLENMRSLNGSRLDYVRSITEYRQLGWNRHDSYMQGHPNSISTGAIKLVKDVKVELSTESSKIVRGAINDFESYALLLRCSFGGGAFFNDVKVFGLTSYSPTTEHLSTLAFADNDIFAGIKKSTEISNPHDWHFDNMLAKIESVDFSDYIFIDRSITRSYFTHKKQSYHEGETNRLFDAMLLISILVFALASLLPDFDDSRDNVKLREIYLPIIMERYFSSNIDKSRDLIILFNKIRNKIAHGHYNKAVKIFTSNFQDIDTFERDSKIFITLIRRLMILSIVNPDFKEVVSDWYNTGDPATETPSIVSPYQKVEAGE